MGYEEISLRNFQLFKHGLSRLPGLIPGLPVLREAFLAIDRPALRRLEGNFALFSTVGTSRLGHFSGTEIAPAIKSAVIHNISLTK